jgi:uncharacterized protein YabN with tetrapyrrole methylase and pyrophosphatase domain
MSRSGGGLDAIGIGIRAPEQSTLQGAALIKYADKVYSLVADPLAEYWIRTLNRETESLGGLYGEGKLRRHTYLEMVERIVGSVRADLRVCAVTYGHPGVSSYPLHESVRRVRAEGFPAKMLAGISAEDCLYADLGIDPIDDGCRSYEATDFLVHRRGIDSASNLILWQIGVIGETTFKPGKEIWNPEGLSVLTQTLLEAYPDDHQVVVYEAAQFPLCEPSIVRTELKKLASAPVTILSTLFVPPATNPVVDEAMMRRLGMRRDIVDSSAEVLCG